MYLQPYAFMVIYAKLTCVIDTISPLAFFIFLSLERKYQKRDLAVTTSGAKIRILYSWGLGTSSDGSLRPITLYSFNCKEKKSLIIYEQAILHNILNTIKLFIDDKPT